MGMRIKPATWLELAAGPRWGRENRDLKLHQISAGCGECFVLSLSGRMLCSSDGKLTVFRSREAVDRFLLLLELETPPAGEHAGLVPSDPSGQHCLRLCGSSLCACNLDDDEDSRSNSAGRGSYGRAERRARDNRSAIV